MNNEATIVIPNWNSLHSLSLTMESFRHHHNYEYPVFVADDKSSDGADTYAMEHATQFFQGDYERSLGCHGLLNLLISKVETPYVLTLDSDVEFLGPCIPAMLTILQNTENCVGVCPKAPMAAGENFGGVFLKGTERFEHYMSLFKTDVLKHWIKYLPLDHYACLTRKLKYDLTGLLYPALLAAGYNFFIDNSFLWKNIIHYGGLSVLWSPGESEAVYDHLNKKYDIIKKRLENLRADKQDLSGLRWTVDAGWKADTGD